MAARKAGTKTKRPERPGGNERRLTAKQEKFVQELLVRDNQRAAYKAAYDCKRMSNEAIDREASVLLRNPKVAKRYGELLGAARARDEKRALNRRERVLAELEAVAFGEREYPYYNGLGEQEERLPSVGQRLKALEMLGKSEKLFTDRIGLDNDDGGLEVNIRVVE